MARGATEASNCAISLADSLRSFSRVARNCACSPSSRVDSPPVKRWRVVLERLSRLEVTSRPACSSSVDSFWLSTPKRLPRSASSAVTVLRVKATATSTCTNRAIPRATNTGRNKRLRNKERTADTREPSTSGAIKLMAHRERVLQQRSCRADAACRQLLRRKTETTKGPRRSPLFIHQSLIRRTDDAERWFRCGPGRWR
ncbi:hypothetical protein D3C84_551380 [compost metagenome]